MRFDKKMCNLDLVIYYYTMLEIMTTYLVDINII
jgi:hypothetical protein